MGVTPSPGLTSIAQVQLGSQGDDTKPSCLLCLLCLLCLPVEIRVQIYTELFGTGKVVLDSGKQQKTFSFISSTAAPIAIVEGRSSQLLRTCKTVLYEARPVLYGNTVSHVIQHTFAGSLPSSFTDDHPSAKSVCEVIWQVECDILKRWYEDDLRFQQATDWASLKSIEIRCRVDAWRGSYCGGVDKRTAFVVGRDQVLKYGARLLDCMGVGGVRTFNRLVEDCRFHGKGEIRIRLTRSRGLPCLDDVVIEELES